ncbi:MAG: hypothetical protein IPM68_14495 [Flavobacteriales bacterium]|nr:hypothetical protein [Flavobacteriales bacterium]
MEVRAHKEINDRLQFLKAAAVTALADFTKEFRPATGTGGAGRPHY